MNLGRTEKPFADRLTNRHTSFPNGTADTNQGGVKPGHALPAMAGVRTINPTRAG